MAEKSDYMKVASAQLLRISSKKENTKDGSDLNENHSKKQNQKSNENSQKSGHNINELNTVQLIELGRLILDKRNAELRLYLSLKKKKNNSTTDEPETEISITINKIAEIAKNISDVDLLPVEHDIKNEEENEVLEKIISLKVLYHDFLKFAESERESIINEDDNELELILSLKNEVLTQIEYLQKTINVNYFSSFPPDYPKKVKADAILTDIHNVMNMIVKIEDENSVNLQSVMESIKTRLNEQEINSKAISKYAFGNLKSHFIDTTK